MRCTCNRYLALRRIVVLPCQYPSQYHQCRVICLCLATDNGQAGARNPSCFPCEACRKPSLQFAGLKSSTLPYIHLFGSDNPGQLFEPRYDLIALAFGKPFMFSANSTIFLPGPAFKLVFV